MLPKWKTQVRVSAVQDVTPLHDGLSWRKYGQKDILGAKYPRSAPPPYLFLGARSSECARATLTWTRARTTNFF
jgi:hypothetical protein